MHANNVSTYQQKHQNRTQCLNTEQTQSMQVHLDCQRWKTGMNNTIQHRNTAISADDGTTTISVLVYVNVTLRVLLICTQSAGQ